MTLNPTPVPPEAANSAAAAVLEDALFQVKRVIVGQDRMVERALVCLLARGHCLIEGVPGLAKTLTVSTLARVIGGSFSRLQFTPDLVPADIVGTRIWRPSREEFDIEWGPVFANIVLADEVNRAPAKVQSARSAARHERYRAHSWCWPPRTPSSQKGSTPFPKPNGTGS
jgi:MoxR-like ATPase